MVFVCDHILHGKEHLDPWTFQEHPTGFCNDLFHLEFDGTEVSADRAIPISLGCPCYGSSPEKPSTPTTDIVNETSLSPSAATAPATEETPAGMSQGNLGSRRVYALRLEGRNRTEELQLMDGKTFADSKSTVLALDSSVIAVPENRLWADNKEFLQRLWEDPAFGKKAARCNHSDNMARPCPIPDEHICRGYEYMDDSIWKQRKPKKKPLYQKEREAPEILLEELPAQLTELIELIEIF